MLCIPATFICAQIACYRFLFWIREKNGNLEFLDNFLGFGSSPLLNLDEKLKFGKRLHQFLAISRLLGRIPTISALIITVLMGIASIYEDPSVIKVIVWTFWVILQCITAYYAIIDSIIFGCFWFVCQTHIQLIIMEISRELVEMQERMILSRRIIGPSKLSRRLRIWYQRYESTRIILKSFDDFSHTFLFILTSTSSALCSGLLFAVLRTESIAIQILFIPIYVGLTLNAVFLLGSATVTSSQGKVLYRIINKTFVHVQGMLMMRDRLMLKMMMEDTGSHRFPAVSLSTVGGTPYDSMSFAAFVVSYVTLFLMMYDFLEQIM